MSGALRVSLVVLVLAISAAAQPQRLEPSMMVYIVTGTQATALYHREGCSWLRPGTTTALKLEEAQKRYFQPHCLCIAGKEGMPPCEAAVASSAPAPAIPASAGSTAAAAVAAAKVTGAPSNTAQTVYVTRTGTKYHSEGCRYLARSQIPMTLKEASARYGPCSFCGPPVMSAPSTMSETPTTAGPVERAAAASPSTAPTSGRCQAITNKGTQCSRRAQPGRAYCWQH